MDGVGSFRGSPASTLSEPPEMPSFDPSPASTMDREEEGGEVAVFLAPPTPSFRDDASVGSLVGVRAWDDAHTRKESCTHKQARTGGRTQTHTTHPSFHTNPGRRG